MEKKVKNNYNWFLSLGTIIAVVVSFAKWNSIIWAIVHGFFGWLYVIYYLIQGY